MEVYHKCRNQLNAKAQLTDAKAQTLKMIS
jgi:hypothetical protein